MVEGMSIYGGTGGSDRDNGGWGWSCGTRTVTWAGASSVYVVVEEGRNRIKAWEGKREGSVRRIAVSVSFHRCYAVRVKAVVKSLNLHLWTESEAAFGAGGR